jgi:ligand-binding sensor domain-containing protein
MTKQLFKSLIILITALTIQACSDPAEKASSKPPAAETKAIETKAVETKPATVAVPKVLESFNVGREVFVRSLAFNKNNNSLWVGSSTGVLEISLSDRQLLNTFTREHGLANEYVFAIYVDSKGYTWFGTNAGGTSRYKDGNWDVYFPMHGLADYWVYSFIEQENGPLWIGTWAGANTVDLETMQFKTYLKELINEWVYGLDIDSQDRVWFGTEGGISMYDGKTWSEWSHKDGVGAANIENLPFSANTGLGTRTRHDLSVVQQGAETYNPSYVFSLLVDERDDSVWAGTWGGGVSRYDGKQWKNYTTADGLAGNIVYSIAQDINGILWFGTNKGLSRFDGESWITYNQTTGLLENNVYAIAALPSGEIWVGTKHGVTRLGQ